MSVRSGKVIIGIDPDMRKPSMAMMDVKSGNTIAVRCIKNTSKAKDRAAVIGCVNSLRGCITSFLKDLGNPELLCVVVEGQEIAYTAREGANPRSIMLLATVAGACLTEAAYETENILFPSPNEWKGGVPKGIHQARILRKMGWEYEVVGSDKKTAYARPTQDLSAVYGANDLNKADWRHVVDSIGLADYAREKIIRRSRDADT